MKIKIVSDSSCDLTQLHGEPFPTAPLSIVCGEREYIDDSSLDVADMLTALESTSAPSHTACPSVGDWLRVFEGGDCIFALTLTGALSGSANSAHAAALEYEKSHPGCEVEVIDTLSVGPETALAIEYMHSLIRGGVCAKEIGTMAREYLKRAHLIFALESMHNLVARGRVSRTSATAAKLLGIRAVGRASREGTLEMTDKAHGLSSTVSVMVRRALTDGWRGGRARIHHVDNLCGAMRLRERMLAQYRHADIEISQSRALCSYYAERGGLLLGFET